MFRMSCTYETLSSEFQGNPKRVRYSPFFPGVHTLRGANRTHNTGIMQARPTGVSDHGESETQLWGGKPEPA